VGLCSERAVTFALVPATYKAAFGTAVSSLFPAGELNASRYNPGFDRAAATLLRRRRFRFWVSRTIRAAIWRTFFRGAPWRDTCAMLACRLIWSYKY